jgi:hypothetical protein
VLLIDGDPQCNLTSFYAPNPNDWDSISYKKKVKRGKKGINIPRSADLYLSAVRPVELVLPATIRAKIFARIFTCASLWQGIKLSEHDVEWVESDALTPDFFDKDTWVGHSHKSPPPLLFVANLITIDLELAG